MIKNETGRSMMEMMGVLGIIGLLSVGGMAGLSQLLSQQKITKTIEQINVMSSKLSQIGAQSGTYEDLDVASAIKIGAVPSSAIETGSTLSNPFGGSIEISGANLTSDNDKQGYTIVYGNIPEDACMALATYKWGAKGGSSLIGVGAALDDTYKASLKSKLKQDCGGETGPAYVVGCSGAGSSGIGVPIDPASAVNACNCPQGNCILVWMYF